MNRVASVSAIGKFLLIAGIALVSAGMGIKQAASENSQVYKYLTPQFQEALNSINIEYFLTPPKPEPHDLKDFYLADQYEEYRNSKLAEAEVAYRHYPILGDQLCEPIAKAYEDILRVPLKGSASAYEFDAELLKAMRNAGAYALPISSGRGNVDGVFIVKDAERMKSEYLKSFDESEKLFSAPKYEPEGRVLFSMGSGARGGGYVRFNEFRNAIKRYGLQEISKFDYDFKFVRSFLFVLGDTTSLNGERIYLYVEFPYKINGSRFGEIDELQYVPAPNISEQVKCYTYSKTGLYYNGMIHKIRFIDQDRAVAPIFDLEPLSIPLHTQYADYEVPRDDGQKGFRKNYYKLEKSEISEQSLECWMLAVGFASGDIKKCQNSGYADEYLKMLNSNICAWKDRTVEAPKIGYPLTVDAALHRADYMRRGLSYINRCSPQPYKKKD